jgi:hypothetical protein
LVSQISFPFGVRWHVSLQSLACTVAALTAKPTSASAITNPIRFITDLRAVGLSPWVALEQTLRESVLIVTTNGLTQF